MSIPREHAERIKLKDDLAPLRRLKEAKQNGSEVGFEWERLQNEELTDIAEAIDYLYLESRFTYGFNGQEVVLPDGTPLKDMYLSGVDVARRLAEIRPEFLFELQRREAEAANQDLINAMMRGEREANTVIELSPFPDEAAAQYSFRHLEENGYKPKLRRGMVRIARREADGTLSLTTFSLDNSTLDQFRHVQALLGQKPGGTTTSILAHPRLLNTNQSTAELARLMSESYDQKLFMETGIKYYRGRPENTGNSMDVLRRSKPIMDFYFNQLDILSTDWATETISLELAKTAQSILNHRADDNGLLPPELRFELMSALNSKRLNETSASIVKRALELSVWASIVSDLENHRLETGPSANFNTMLNQAYDAQAAGNYMVGCGGVTNLFETNRDESMLSIFSLFNRLELRYSFNRKMHCVVCQKPPKKNPRTNRTEHKKWCGPCGICAGCDRQIQKKTN